MKNYLLIAACLFGLVLQTAQAKVALVIGNDDYAERYFGRLDNAVNDARTLTNKLQNLGFEVIKKENLTAAAMREALNEFSDRLARNNDVGLFYFAGHGIQHEGVNYLIPISARIERTSDAETEAINADLILNRMQDRAVNAKTNIFILDACRDNNLPNRGGSRGLASIARAKSFIAYATQPDTASSDNTARAGNGIFMQYFARRINEPLPIEQMFKNVIKDVRDATRQEQVPSYTYNLIDDFYFVAPSPPSTPAPILPSVTPPSPPRQAFEPEMVLIKKGCFQMGSPDGNNRTRAEPGRRDDETQIGRRV